MSVMPRHSHFFVLFGSAAPFSERTQPTLPPPAHRLFQILLLFAGCYPLSSRCANYFNFFSVFLRKMPVARVQVRNEYALGQPELYKNVNKEDPKAVLEGVAVSGLVGILRLLGDLSEFAVEVFHGLQEEVVSTSHRSHKLIARLQHMENALPRFEKALLSQTSHVHLAYNSGSAWHPKIHKRRHLFHTGMPTYMTDAYKKCRRPPCLDLLDKFDISGPGSCFKRYSDPSFFGRVATFRSEGYARKRVDNTGVHRSKKRSWQWDEEGLRRTSSSRHGRRTQSVTFGAIKESFHSLLEVEPRICLDKRSHSFISRKGSNYIECVINSRTAKYNGSTSFISEAQNIDQDVPIYPSNKHVISSCPLSEPPMQETSFALPFANSHKEMKMLKQDDPHFDREILELCSAIGHATTGESKASESKHQAVSVHIQPFIPINKEFDDIDSEADNFLDALNTIESESENDVRCETKEELTGQSVPYEMCEYRILPEDHQPSLASKNAPFSTFKLASSVDLSNSASPEHGLRDFIVDISDLELVVSDTCFGDTKCNDIKVAPFLGQAFPHSIILPPHVPSYDEARMIFPDGYFCTDVVTDFVDQGCLPEFGIQGSNMISDGPTPKSVNGLSSLAYLESSTEGSSEKSDDFVPESEGSSEKCDDFVPESEGSSEKSDVVPESEGSSEKSDDFVLESVTVPLSLPLNAVDVSTSSSCIDYTDQESLPVIDVHESSDCPDDIKLHSDTNDSLPFNITITASQTSHFGGAAEDSLVCAAGRNNFVDDIIDGSTCNPGELKQNSVGILSFNYHDVQVSGTPYCASSGCLSSGGNLLPDASESCTVESTLVAANSIHRPDDIRLDFVRECSSPPLSISLLNEQYQGETMVHSLECHSCGVVNNSAAQDESPDILEAGFLSSDLLLVPAFHHSNQNNFADVAEAGSYSSNCSLLPFAGHNIADQCNLKDPVTPTKCSSPKISLLPSVSNDSPDQSNAPDICMGTSSFLCCSLLLDVANDSTDLAILPGIGMGIESSSSRYCLLHDINSSTGQDDFLIGAESRSPTLRCLLPVVDNDSTAQSNTPIISLEAGCPASRCVFSDVYNDHTAQSNLTIVGEIVGCSSSKSTILLDTANDFTHPSDVPADVVEAGFSPGYILLPGVAKNCADKSQFSAISMEDGLFSLECSSLPDATNDSIDQSVLPAITVESEFQSPRCGLLPVNDFTKSRYNLLAIAASDSIAVDQSNFPVNGMDCGFSTLNCTLFPDARCSTSCLSGLPDTDEESNSSSIQSLCTVVPIDSTRHSNLSDNAEVESSSRCVLPNIPNDSPGHGDLPATIVEAGCFSTCSLLPDASIDSTDQNNLRDFGVDDGCCTLRCGLLDSAGNDTNNQSDIPAACMYSRSASRRNLLPVACDDSTDRCNLPDIDAEVESSSSSCCLLPAISDSFPGQVDLPATSMEAGFSSGCSSLPDTLIGSNDQSNLPDSVDDGRSTLRCSLFPNAANDTTNRSDLVVSRSPSRQGFLPVVSYGSADQTNLLDSGVKIEYSSSRCCVLPGVTNGFPGYGDLRQNPMDTSSFSSCSLLPDVAIDSTDKSNLQDVLEDGFSLSRCLLGNSANGSTGQSNFPSISMESELPSLRCSLLTPPTDDSANQSNFSDIRVKCGSSSGCSISSNVAADLSCQDDLATIILETASFSRCRSLPNSASDSIDHSNLLDINMGNRSSSRYNLLPNVAHSSADQNGLASIYVDDGSVSLQHSLSPHISDHTHRTNLPDTGVKTGSPSTCDLSSDVATDSIGVKTGSSSTCSLSSDFTTGSVTGNSSVDPIYYHSYGEDIRHKAYNLDVPLSPIQFWTNGGLLGLEPSKPVDFNRSSTPRIETPHLYQPVDFKHSSTPRIEAPHLYQDNNRNCNTVDLIDRAGDLFSTHNVDDVCDVLCSQRRNTIPSSPPLELMELSGQPFNSSEASQLKLIFSSECKDTEGLSFTLPSFQLAHDQTLSPIDIISDSDDDTFFGSSPLSSHYWLGESYETNSGDWEAQKNLESENKALYDEALSRIELDICSLGGREVRCFLCTNVKEQSQSETLNDLLCVCAVKFSDMECKCVSLSNPVSASQNELAEIHAEECQDFTGSTFCVETKDPKQLCRTEDMNYAASERATHVQNSFLQQIKMKSLGLRPMAMDKPVENPVLRNSKVIAILEKARSIRKAVGNDCEEDDYWSDT